MINKIKVGILGATGFTGEKLAGILLKHPRVEIAYLASRSEVTYSKLFPQFKGKISLKCEPFDIDKAAQRCDLLFLSLPHTTSMEFVPYLLKKKKKVIDLSADYRIKDSLVYKKYYKLAHKDKLNLKKGVYGLPEIYKNSIKSAQLIANPGCYPTSIILALFPLLKEGLIKSEVIADSKSAITGAGRKTAKAHGYPDNLKNFWAYQPFVHQHTPEMLSVLKNSTKKSINLLFTPHVASIEAGIYSTIYVTLKNKVSDKRIKSIYSKYYKKSPFVRVLTELPKLKEVVGSNFCDIGFAVGPKSKKVIIAACLDNLIKGAAGQAVQNMNIMMGWKETLGLL